MPPHVSLPPRSEERQVFPAGAPRRRAARAGLTTAGVALWVGAVVLHAHPDHHLAQVTPSPLRQDSRATSAATTPLRTEARLTLAITDAKSGRPTTARVRITDATGRPLGLGLSAALPATGDARLAEPGTVPGLPASAVGVMYGRQDLAEGYAFQPDGSFYVDGGFDLPMPAGAFSVTIAKGYEFVREQLELAFKPGDHVERKVALRRWIDMPSRGWYSSDGHIHLRRSPRENPIIRQWTSAEDIHVGVLLQMGDNLMTYFPQYGFGRKGVYGENGYMLASGQEEPRTPEIGHTLSVGAEQFVRYRDDYYAYDRVFDRIRALGGVSGYAHQAMSFHGYRGLTLDVLNGKIDYLELLQFCVPEGPMATEHYYRLLDLGYKLTALAGSDFPWCGRGRRAGEEQVGAQIGDARFYTYLGTELSYERWIEALKAGRTFVTSGPMLEFRVNGQVPGTAIDVKPGATLQITASAEGLASMIPLQRLEIVSHGNVIAEARAGDAGQTAQKLTITTELKPAHGLWIAARAYAGASQMAHTTPVYVTVKGDGFHTRSNLAAQIERSRRALQEIRELLRPTPAAGQGAATPAAAPLPGSPAAHARLEQRIAEAERRLNELAVRR